MHALVDPIARRAEEPRFVGMRNRDDEIARGHRRRDEEREHGERQHGAEARRHDSEQCKEPERPDGHERGGVDRGTEAIDEARAERVRDRARDNEVVPRREREQHEHREADDDRHATRRALLARQVEGEDEEEERRKCREIASEQVRREACGERADLRADGEHRAQGHEDERAHRWVTLALARDVDE